MDQVVILNENGDFFRTRDRSQTIPLDNGRSSPDFFIGTEMKWSDAEPGADVLWLGILAISMHRHGP